MKKVISILIPGICFLLLSGCEKDDKVSVDTTAVIEVAHKTAKAGGIVGSGENLVNRGLCWGTSDNPTIDKDMHTSEGTSNLLSSIEGPFTHVMTSLKPSTTYYFRAYLIYESSENIIYGETQKFTTLPGQGTIKDIEGNEYQIAKIGNQTWMAENLRTKHYSNGDEIPTTEPVSQRVGESTVGYQWAANGEELYVPDYGRLYNWYAITDSRNVCPSGWRVPGDYDWEILFTYLGGMENANKLREQGDVHWGRSSGGNNSSDFTAVGSGYRAHAFPDISQASFYSLNSEAWIWSSHNIYSQDDAFYGYKLSWNSTIFRTWGTNADDAFAVRCIKE